MGVDLGGNGAYFSANWRGWRWLLSLACDHGWQPAGTEWNLEVHRWLSGGVDEKEEERARNDWDGDYFSNDGQIVSARHAANLADALEKANGEVDSPWVAEAIQFFRRGSFMIA